jgi:hypothetical protein
MPVIRVCSVLHFDMNKHPLVTSTLAENLDQFVYESDICLVLRNGNELGEFFV